MMVAAAGLQAAGDSVSVTADVTYASKYIFRGVVLGENAFHPSVEVSANDFYAGVWANIPLGSRSEYPDNEEFDFYFGRNFKLSDVVSLDAGYTYYYYPQLEGVPHHGPSEVYLGINFDANGFFPAAYAYYDFDKKAWTFQGSVGTSIPLQTVGASLDLTATLGHGDASGFNYTYWSLGAAVPYRLSDQATITAGVTFASHGIDGLKDDNVAGSLSFTFGF